MMIVVVVEKKDELETKQKKIQAHYFFPSPSSGSRSDTFYC